MEDGRHWALWNAGFAIDAFVRVNEKDCFPFIKTFNWTYDHAVCVFAVEARFSDDMSHWVAFLTRGSGHAQK